MSRSRPQIKRLDDCLEKARYWLNRGIACLDDSHLGLAESNELFYSIEDIDRDLEAIRTRVENYELEAERAQRAA